MVTSFTNLIVLATRYALLSEASLRSDMAKRIMYSILPGVASPTQTMATQGVVDLKALRAAVEGRKDIIKYGVNACMKELRHYEGGMTAQEVGEAPTALRSGKPYHLARALANQGDNEKALDIAVKLFGDKDAWPPSYGGEAWLNIAKTLKQITALDKQLDSVRASRATDPEAMDKEIIIMQQLIVAMNVFDGLSHNTASILSNLVEEEALATQRDASTPELYESTGGEFKAIQRMMDAKELHNPVQVFREIEPSLVESGDINRYKDWVSPLRRDPSYRAEDPGLEKEKFLIRFRKQLLHYRSLINRERDNMRKTTEKVLAAGPQSLSVVYRNLEALIENFANTTDLVLGFVENNYITPPDDIEHPISNELRESYVRKLHDGIKKVSMDARLKVELARNKLEPIAQKYRAQKQKGAVSQTTMSEFQTAVYEVMKTVYEGYGSLAFYLDSI